MSLTPTLNESARSITSELMRCAVLLRSAAPHHHRHPTVRRRSQVVSINNTTQVDLGGQAASESDGMRHISGTGGQLQFVRGAYASPGGKSFICLASTFERGEVRTSTRPGVFQPHRGPPSHPIAISRAYTQVRKSRIVFNLTMGNTVTAPRSEISLPSRSVSLHPAPSRFNCLHLAPPPVTR